MASFKVQVKTDDSGVWYGNGLRFETRAEAEANAANLAARWLAVRDWRTVECDDAPTYRWDINNGLVPLNNGAE
jgi:hypothetical protein